MASHWWSWSGSNRRPPECKSGALPAELQPLNPENQEPVQSAECTFAFLTPWILGSLNSRFSLRGQLDAGTGKIDSPATSKPFHILRVEIARRAHQKLRRAPDGLWSGTAAFYRLTLYTQALLLSKTPPTFSLRKEVIQPQVLLRLPCYDFTPIMNHTLGRCLPCGSARRLLVQSTFVM